MTSTFSKETQIDGTVIVFLKGILDSGLNLKKIVGVFPLRLIINCKGINHVNSSVVLPWIQYFTKLQSESVPFSFSECTDSLLCYFNAYPKMLCGGQVESVYAPFYCARCDKQTDILLDSFEMKKLDQCLTNRQCSACTSNLDFDDSPEDYFYFLNK